VLRARFAYLLLQECDRPCFGILLVHPDFGRFALLDAAHIEGDPQPTGRAGKSSRFPDCFPSLAASFQELLQRLDDQVLVCRLIASIRTRSHRDCVTRMLVMMIFSFGFAIPWKIAPCARLGRKRVLLFALVQVVNGNSNGSRRSRMMTYRLKPGNSEKFLEASRQLRSAYKDQTGFVDLLTFISDERPDRARVIAIWRTKSDSTEFYLNYAPLLDVKPFLEEHEIRALPS
jgi:hypothetical protein